MSQRRHLILYLLVLSLPYYSAEGGVPFSIADCRGNLDPIIFSANPEEQYLPHGYCVLIQVSKDAGSAVEAGFQGRVFLRTDRGDRFICALVFYDVAAGSNFTVSDDGGEALLNCSGGTECATYLASPRERIAFAFRNGRKAGGGPQYRCFSQPSPCGECSSSQPIPVNLNAQTPFTRIHSPVFGAGENMPPACECRYAIEASDGGLISLDEEFLSPDTEGCLIEGRGECLQSFSPSNRSRLFLDRRIEFRVRSSQPQPGSNFSYQYLVRIANVTQDPSCLPLPPRSTPQPNKADNWMVPWWSLVIVYVVLIIALALAAGTVACLFYHRRRRSRASSAAPEDIPLTCLPLRARKREPQVAVQPGPDHQEESGDGEAPRAGMARYPDVARVPPNYGRVSHAPTAPGNLGGEGGQEPVVERQPTELHSLEAPPSLALPSLNSNETAPEVQEARHQATVDRHSQRPGPQGLHESLHE